MSEPIRFELTGKNAEVWNRMYETLTSVVIDGMSSFAPMDDSERESTCQLLMDLAGITGGWAKAKLERPSLENEKLIAEIAEKFEDLKLKQAQRKTIELENESKRLDLMVKRVETAIKLLGMLNSCFHFENGKLTLILTNQSLSLLHADVKALSQQQSEEAV